MPKSTTSPRQNKPAKPHADFPLFPHATRRWAKKVRGKVHYFGPWEDPDAALNKWLEQKDDLLAGRTPRVREDGLSNRELCNRFLTSKRHLLDSGEITARTFQGNYATCETLVGFFGKGRLVVDLAADDFERLRAALSKTRGAVALGNEIQRVRSAFKYAFENGLIDRPVRFGSLFKKPSRKVLRQVRQANGKRMFPAEELRTSGLVFITKYGQRWVRTSASGTPDDAVGKEFAKLLHSLNLKRKGVSFYALRHTFETIGGESKDQVAVDHIMGHTREDLASLYREHISDERLLAVTDIVHRWLFPPSDAGPDSTR